MTRHDALDLLGRLRRSLLLLVAWGAVLLASGGGALAHASLVGVEPVDGAVVARAPTGFKLTFSEPTSPLVLALVRPDGARTTLDRFVLRGSTLDIAAPAGLGDGTYVLTWRVVSEDGHPVGGSTVFSIGAPSAGGGVVAEAIDWPLRAAVWAARVALYGGLFIGIGGVVFARWIGGGSPGSCKVALGSLLAGLVAAPLSLGLQGLDALGVPLEAIARPIVWETAWTTSYATMVLVAVAALAAGLAALAVPAALTGAGRALSLAALAGVGLALAASGHASAAHPEWLTRPAVFLHAVGIALWAGALAPLGATFAAPRPDAGAVLRRFSVAIPFAVLPLVATGMLLALIQLGSLPALWTTAYGWVLVAKLVLVVALFALAADNRFRLTAPAERGDGGAIRRLRRSIGLELVLVLAIFAVAAVWRFTPPPRALAAAAAAPAAIHIHTAQAMADLAITPGRVGPTTASIVVMTGDFGPLDPKAITLVVANRAAGIEPIRRAAARVGDGTWRVEALTLPQPGRWSVRLDVLISDFELVKLDGEVVIRP